MRYQIATQEDAKLVYDNRNTLMKICGAWPQAVCVSLKLHFIYAELQSVSSSLESLGAGESKLPVFLSFSSVTRSSVSSLLVDFLSN